MLTKLRDDRPRFHKGKTAQSYVAPENRSIGDSLPSEKTDTPSNAISMTSPSVPIRAEDSVISNTSPLAKMRGPEVANTATMVFLSRHIFNRDNAWSRDEDMFLLFASVLGIQTAIEKATTHVPRPSAVRTRKRFLLPI
jgi:hypothetical protein